MANNNAFTDPVVNDAGGFSDPVVEDNAPSFTDPVVDEAKENHNNGLRQRLKQKDSLLNKIGYVKNRTKEDKPDAEGLTLDDYRNFVSSSDFNTLDEERLNLVAQAVDAKHADVSKKRGIFKIAADSVARGIPKAIYRTAEGRMAAQADSQENRDTIQSHIDAEAETDVNHPRAVAGVKDIRGVGDALKLAVEVTGENVGNAVAPLAAGYAGAKAGLVAGGPVGAVIGAKVGSGIGSLSGNLGEAVRDHYNDTGEAGTSVGVVAQGIGYSVIDAVLGGEATAIKHLFKGVSGETLKAAKKNFVGSIGKAVLEVVKGGAKGGLGEALQSQVVGRSRRLAETGSAFEKGESGTDALWAAADEFYGGFFGDAGSSAIGVGVEYSRNKTMLRRADVVISKLSADKDVDSIKGFDKKLVADYMIGMSVMSDVDAKTQDAIRAKQAEIMDAADGKTKTILNAYQSMFTDASFDNIPDTVKPTFNAQKAYESKIDEQDGSETYFDADSGIMIQGREGSWSVFNRNGMKMPLTEENNVKTIKDAIGFAQNLTRLNQWRVENNQAKSEFIQKLAEKNHPGANVVMVDSPLQIKDEGIRSRFIGNEQGFYNPGDNTVYMMLDAVQNPAQAAIVLNHEDFHSGFDATLKATGKSRDELLGKTGLGDNVTAEEYLAEAYAQREKDPATYSKAKLAVQKWIGEKTGIKSLVGDAEMKLLIQKVSAQNKERGNGAVEYQQEGQSDANQIRYEDAKNGRLTLEEEAQRQNDDAPDEKVSQERVINRDTRRAGLVAGMNQDTPAPSVIENPSGVPSVQTDTDTSEVARPASTVKDFVKTELRTDRIKEKHGDLFNQAMDVTDGDEQAATGLVSEWLAGQNIADKSIPDSVRVASKLEQKAELSPKDVDALEQNAIFGKDLFLFGYRKDKQTGSWKFQEPVQETDQEPPQSTPVEPVSSEPVPAEKPVAHSVDINALLDSENELVSKRISLRVKQRDWSTANKLSKEPKPETDNPFTGQLKGVEKTLKQTRQSIYKSDASLKPVFGEKQEKESFKAFFDAMNQGGEFDLLQHWHEGRGLFASPDKDADGGYDAYRALPKTLRKMIVWKGSKQTIDKVAGEIAGMDWGKPEYADGIVGVEMLVSDWVYQYNAYQQWKAEGSPSRSDIEGKRYEAEHRQEQEDLATYKQKVDNGDVLADGSFIAVRTGADTVRMAGVDPEWPIVRVERSRVVNGILVYDAVLPSGSVFTVNADEIEADLGKETEVDDEAERNSFESSYELSELAARKVREDRERDYERNEREAIAGEATLRNTGESQGAVQEDEVGKGTGEVAPRGKNDGSLFDEGDLDFNLDGGTQEDVVRIAAEKKAEEAQQAEAKRKLDAAPVLPGIDSPAVKESLTTEKATPNVSLKRGTKVATTRNADGISYFGEVLQSNPDGTVKIRAFKEKAKGTIAAKTYGVDKAGNRVTKDVDVPSQSVKAVDASADPSKLTESDKRRMAIGEAITRQDGEIDHSEEIRREQAAAEKDALVDRDLRFRRRTAPPPAKTVTAYKLFRIDRRQPGKLFPLFVLANDSVDIGIWLDAEEGERKGNGVKSKLGQLAYRPGWHAGDVPIATHIGDKKNKTDAKPSYRSDDHVWAEVEMAADVDWQAEANKRGTNEKGVLVGRNAAITDQIPVDGFYRYKTNPNMTGTWLIGGSIKVTRILSDEDVKAINDKAGVADLPRKIPFDAKGYGEDGGVRFRRMTVTPEQDAAYMKAVERGDMETAQRMVDVAARDSFLRGVNEAIPSGGTYSFEEYAGPTYLELSDLRSDKQGSGWGSRAMQTIATIADKYKISLLALPVGDIGSEKWTRLVDFYGRYNFEGDEAMHRMVRKPEAVTRDDAGNVIPLSERFNDESSDIRFRRSMAGTPSGADILDTETGLQAARRIVQDYMQPWERKQESLQKALKRKLSDDVDVYRAEDRSYGLIRNGVHQFEKNFIDKAEKVLNENGLTVDEFDQFLMAKAGPDRNKMIADRTDGKNLTGSGQSDVYWNNILAAYRKQGKYDKLNEAAEHVWALNRAVLDMKVEAGLMSKAQADVWKTKSPFYVPLRSDDAEADYKELGKRASFSLKRKESKSATGRAEGHEADTPFAFSVMQSLEAVGRANKNVVYETATKLIEQNPSDLWHIEKRIPTKQAYDSESGKVISVPDAQFEDAPNVVIVKRDGKKQYLVFEGADGLKLARSLKKDSLQKAPVIVSALTRTYAMMRTAMVPTFILRNLRADFLQLTINMTAENKARMVPEVFKSMKDSWQAVWSYERDGKASGALAGYANEFFSNGGQIAGVGVQTVDKINQTLNKHVKKHGAMMQKVMKAEHFYEYIERGNATIETGTRLALYATLRKKGYSISDSIEAGKNITVNFNRKGELGPLVNSLYMFSNVAVQDAARSVKALSGKNGKAVVLGLLGAGFLAAMLNNGDDDKEDKTGAGNYKNIPESDKQRNIIIKVGGKYVKQPIRGIWAWVYYAGTKAGDVAFGKYDSAKAAKNVAGAAFDTINFLGTSGSVAQFVTPTILDPVVQHLENKDWKGDPMRQRKFTDAQPDSATGMKRTPEWIKSAASVINKATGGDDATKGLIDVAPETIKHVIDTLTGGLGTDASYAVGAVSDAAKGNFDVDKTPFVRDVVRDLPDSTREYYVAKDRFDEGVYQMNHYKASKDKRRLMAESPFMKPTTAERIKNLNKTIKEIRELESKTESDDRKRSLETRRLRLQSTVVSLVGR